VSKTEERKKERNYPATMMIMYTSFISYPCVSLPSHFKFSVFREKGYQVVLASIAGGEIPIDSASLQGDGYVAASKKFMQDDPDALQKLQQSICLSDIDISSVDAIFLAGGHGTCVDFVGSLELKQAIEKLYGANKIVAAVCHGPMALPQCVKPDGSHLVEGKTVTGFSNTEETAVQLVDKVPFLLETKLKEQGANYERSENDWTSKVCVDGNLITGQNPQSSEECAKAVVKALG
jgi:putative intracellular protease/amidase